MFDIETISALLAICAGNSPVTGEFPVQRPVTRKFDVFFDLRPNKRLSKRWWGWWFETPSRPLWRYCNANFTICTLYSFQFIQAWSKICSSFVQPVIRAWHRCVTRTNAVLFSVGSDKNKLQQNFNQYAKKPLKKMRMDMSLTKCWRFVKTATWKLIKAEWFIHASVN